MSTHTWKKERTAIILIVDGLYAVSNYERKGNPITIDRFEFKAEAMRWAYNHGYVFASGPGCYRPGAKIRNQLKGKTN